MFPHKRGSESPEFFAILWQNACHYPWSCALIGLTKLYHFTPPAPKTHPGLEKLRKYEGYVDIDGLLKEALDGITITEIRPGDNYFNQNEDVVAESL